MSTSAQDIENKARELYEESRKRVSGRPSWENLNMSDPYDMGMRSTAIERAKMVLNVGGIEE